MSKRTLVGCVVSGLVIAGTLASNATAGAFATTNQVLAAVKASVTITTVPSTLDPSLQSVASNGESTAVNAAAYILNSCDPYWTHTQAMNPIPCWYGDTSAKKTFVLFGDSNAGMWAPALNAILKPMHIRLALFGFIGCGTSFVPETSTTQPNSFATQWQLCDTWHDNLPAAVRKLKPFAVAEASTPFRYGHNAYYDGWVAGMREAFYEMTQGAPKTIRLELGTIPLFPTSTATCLASYPTDVQMCASDYTGASNAYHGILARDSTIASESHAKLVHTWPWLCYEEHCSPVVSTFLTVIDQDHLSTPYSLYLAGAMKQALVKLKILS